MCVHTTLPLVNVSPVMAENVILFFPHHFKNLCFIMLVVLVINCALQFGCKVFVAVAGLEPATSCQYVGRILQVTALYH